VIRNATLRISDLRQVGLQQADLSQIDNLRSTTLSLMTVKVTNPGPEAKELAV